MGADKEPPEKPERAANAERARQWREKASELRDMAEGATFEETKATMVSLAHSYERLATVMEHAPVDLGRSPDADGKAERRRKRSSE